jgi:hypothetical protein
LSSCVSSSIFCKRSDAGRAADGISRPTHRFAITAGGMLFWSENGAARWSSARTLFEIYISSRTGNLTSNKYLDIDALAQRHKMFMRV